MIFLQGMKPPSKSRVPTLSPSCSSPAKTTKSLPIMWPTPEAPCLLLLPSMKPSEPPAQTSQWALSPMITLPMLPLPCTLMLSQTSMSPSLSTRSSPSRTWMSNQLCSDPLNNSLSVSTEPTNSTSGLLMALTLSTALLRLPRCLSPTTTSCAPIWPSITKLRSTCRLLTLLPPFRANGLKSFLWLCADSVYQRSMRRAGSYLASCRCLPRSASFAAAETLLEQPADQKISLRFF